jgi:hypothetical protein
MTEEQKEILINAYKAYRSGEITKEQYQDIRYMLSQEMMESK